jgi:probable F420-dependent oxidoreductase
VALDIGPVGIWTGTLDGQPSSRGREVVQEIEAMGYRTLWIPEATGRHPFVSAALWLDATSSLVIATGIANIYARDAMASAAGQKTLAEAFPGRFLLGLGTSSPALVEKVRGHDASKPYSYMKAYLEAMDEARFTALGPAEPPPRVLGALGPKMLALAVSHAAGAHPYLTTPDHTRTAREIMGPAALLAPEQMVVLEEDPSTARAIGRGSVGFYMRAPGYLANLRRLGFSDDDWADPRNPSDRLVDAVVAWGDLDTVTRRIREHHDAGADHVAVQVLKGDRELALPEWRRLAEALL